MKFGILGTGYVGISIASKLIELGHAVTLGSRTVENESAVKWAEEHGDLASNGTFLDAASFGEIIFNCTLGEFSLDALAAAGRENLEGKILIDVSNPLIVGDYLALVPELSNTTSLGEEIQKKYPQTRVVKTLNTMAFNLMVNPGLLEDKHTVFICSDDDDAKEQVKEILHWFGWETSLDLGKLANSRYTERLSTLWVPIYKATGNPLFAFKVTTNPNSK
ncbi:NADPH-dependent F420 reductase [Pedobacter agri]|uniref:NADPH-dependent F420 reductase n=1 Tax=Pedobacter agri TaxID=454586 RepID=UPI0029315080|nr:NAD(P)-binding domain-containing protein [Pedobacter agri]